MLTKKLVLFFLSLFVCPPLLALCVTADKANLRSGPGTKYKVSWVVGKNMPLKEVSRKGNWYKVKDVDGAIHYVHRRLVTKKYTCVVVRRRYTNLRKGPATKFPLADIRIADKYTPFKKVGREDAWLLLEDELGQQYWVYDKSMWQPMSYVQVTF